MDWSSKTKNYWLTSRILWVRSMQTQLQSIPDVTYAEPGYVVRQKQVFSPHFVKGCFVHRKTRVEILQRVVVSEWWPNAAGPAFKAREYRALKPVTVESCQGDAPRTFRQASGKRLQPCLKDGKFHIFKQVTWQEEQILMDYWHNGTYAGTARIWVS